MKEVGEGCEGRPELRLWCSEDCALAVVLQSWCSGCGAPKMKEAKVAAKKIFYNVAKPDFKQQDEELEVLTESVQRIGSVGLPLHDELHAQEKLLEELGSEMDSTSNRLNFVQVFE